VHRHRSRSGRDARYLLTYAALRADPAGVTEPEARKFVELVGPVCPDAVEEAEASDCDLVAVTPYLYWTSIEAVQALGRRVVFHGAAHDEAEFHLPIMRRVFEAVGGFSYNSFAERALVERAFRVAPLPASVIGNAVVYGSGDPVAARRALGLEADEPFVLCLGKVERSKGTHLLVHLWELYRKRRPDAPRLVFIGPVHEALPPSSGVVVAGSQPEETKWGALAASTLLVSPSAWESFGLVVVEAWLAGKPVLVNRRCAPTVEHCRRSGGGLWFGEYGEFEAAIDLLLADSGLRDHLADKGAEYARSEFAWPAIIDRYGDLAERILTTFPRRSQGAKLGSQA
jgi:glycosyltransferase involved in cell wall biosynthesis